MLFRRQSTMNDELGTLRPVHAREVDANGPAALPPTPNSAEALLKGKSAAIGTSSSTTSMEIGRHRPIKQFKPKLGRLARNLVIGARATDDVHSAYNRLRTQVVRRLQENDWNTVAVTSPSRGSGSTLTAINLAISFARNVSSAVLLVELNLVNPSFRQIFGFKPQHGITDHLLRDVPVSEILLAPNLNRLVVIPAGSPVSNSSVLLSSPKLTRLIEELKIRYEHPIILFDLPSVLAVDDAMAFSPFVDCALLVVEEGETRVNDVRRALDDLRSTKILGVVLNRSVHS